MSTNTVSADGFDGGENIEVTLLACSSGYGEGTCVTSRQDDCRYACPGADNSGPSSVQTEQSVELTGDSVPHSSAITNGAGSIASGATLVRRVDTGSSFVSTNTVSANGFDSGETIEVTLQTWSSGFDTGTSTTATKTITVTAAAGADDHRTKHGSSGPRNPAHR